MIYLHQETSRLQSTYTLLHKSHVNEHNFWLVKLEWDYDSVTVIYYNYVLLPESQIDNKDHGVCK